MSAAYARYVSLVLFLLLLLGRSHAWEGLDKDKKLLMTMCNDLVIDLARKADAVWLYRKAYAQYVSFAVGERVYLIQARFAAQLRTYLRHQLNAKSYDVKTMLQYALILQKRTQGIYVLSDELTDFDRMISTEANPLNASRFRPPNCQNTGPPCSIIPITEGYRRNLGAMDEALKLIDARRKFIKQKYYPRKKTAVDIAAELNKSLNFKFTTLSRYESRDMNMDFVDLAPELIN